MRFMKILGWSFLGLVVVSILGVAAVLLLVDPNDYRAEIAQKVKAETGRELKIEGDLGLSFFPWLALKLGSTELGNPADFGTGAFAAIKNADVGVRLWPLLHGQLEVRRIELEGLQLNLVTDAEGNNNWQFPEHNDESDDQKDDGRTVRIAGVIVKNSGLDYVDTKAGSHYRITGLELETGRLQPGEPFDLKFTGTLDQGEGSSTTQLKLDAQASIDTAAERYSFKDFTLDAKLKPAGKPGGKPPAELPLKLQMPALEVDIEQQTLQAPQFTLALGAAQVDGTLTGSKIVDEPSFAGRIALKQASPRELLKVLGIEAPQTHDPEALKTIAFDASLSATPSSVELQDLKLKLDDTQMTGRFGVADFDTAALRFDLNVDRIDLDRYLPPSSEKEGSEKPSQGKPSKDAPSKPAELPLDMLKELNAQGTLDIGALTVSGVKLSAVKVKVDAADGVVKLDRSQAKLYGGMHRGTVAIDARNPVAKLSLQENLSGIDFAPLMLELFESKRFTGRGNATASLVARGNDTDTLFKSLDGKLDFSVADGAILGADLGYEVRRAQALIKREALPSEASSGKTAFKTMKGSATIARSVLDNRDLAIETDYLKVAGGGTLNLQTQAIDYKVNTVVAGKNQGVEIPVRISGTLADMKIRPDIEARVKAEVQKKVDEKKEEIKDKLTDKLNKWLEKKK